MKCALVICTFQRPDSLIQLIESINKQTRYPDQIVIVDGSPDDRTKRKLEDQIFNNLHYFLVDSTNRGLTRQRNFGISKVEKTIDVVFFLDDDVLLTPGYVETVLKTYEEKSDAKGVGGYISNEAEWERTEKKKEGLFYFDGWARVLGSRNGLRKKIGLLEKESPGWMPRYSHGFSTNFLPPSGRVYPVEYFMGCAMSFKKEVFNTIHFSSYFEGYGLYEDMDFCLRVAQTGALYVNTSAQLTHHHDPEGRPNKFKYGKMVIRNGWYVWRLKYPDPGLSSRIKWHSTSLLLTLVRMGNIFSTSKRIEALTETLGRIAGWATLAWNKPRIDR